MFQDVCVLKEEQWTILNLFHSSFCGGHYAPRITTFKFFKPNSSCLNFLKMILSIILVF